MELYASSPGYAEAHILSSIIAWMANRNVHWDLRVDGPYGENRVVDCDDKLFGVVEHSAKAELNAIIDADEERQQREFHDWMRAWLDRALVT